MNPMDDFAESRTRNLTNLAHLWALTIISQRDFSSKRLSNTDESMTTVSFAFKEDKKNRKRRKRKRRKRKKTKTIRSFVLTRRRSVAQMRISPTASTLFHLLFSPLVDLCRNTVIKNANINVHLPKKKINSTASIVDCTQFSLCVNTVGDPK